MPASKIQNEDEVKRWFTEGKSYTEMCDLYRTKYNIETVPSLWGNFRRRHGLPRRFARNDNLIPWAVAKDHAYAYPLAMLRIEGRVREGMSIRDTDRARLESWKAEREEQGTVVHYDPETEQGFFYVPAEPGDDLIRQPRQKTTQRRNADDQVNVR